jgi:heme-degrading monooxygenase HmoA
VKSPWKSRQALEPDREYLVLASSIPPLSRSSTWALFRGASAVRKQLGQTDGVVGFALLARPWKKQYATLSIWDDEAALAAFSHAQPHEHLMKDLAPRMGDTKFVRWTIRGRDGRPSWDAALERLT